MSLFWGCHSVYTGLKRCAFVGFSFSMMLNYCVCVCVQVSMCVRVSE